MKTGDARTTGTGELVDWVLGELPAEAGKALRQQIQADAATAVEAAEVRMLLEDLRSLTVEPTGRVALAVRAAVHRRRALRGAARPSGVWSQPRALRTVALQVAAVAGIVLLGLCLVRAWQQPGVGEDGQQAELPLIAAAEPVPTVWMAPDRSASRGWSGVLEAADESAQLRDPLQRLAAVGPFTRLVAASNELALLRLEFTQRFSPAARRASILRYGGRPHLEHRLQDLATAVADRLGLVLDEDRGTVAEVALGLRALLAAGSSDTVGGHRDVVRRAQRWLEQRLETTDGGELATALAALTDFAVVTSGRAAGLVAEHGSRLARATIYGQSVVPHDAGGAGPEMVGWVRSDVPVVSLADAGQVLRLAPAFGVHPIDAARARLMVWQHLEQRLARAVGERPDLAAAALYGFSDLVDRAAMDRRLVLWRPRLLAAVDLVALHHWSWSQFPVRHGFGQFQGELRGLATLPNPASLRDASALLLSLAMSFAAPGAQQILDLATE